MSQYSCDSSYYQKSYSFEKNIWTYDDPVSFEFEISDTSQVYDMVLTVDHKDHFPYQNLYLNTSTTFPSDTTITQNLSLEMANAAGFWFSDCTGPNCQIAIPIQSKVHFREIGNYIVSFEQYTRTDSLSGLRSIKLQLLIPQK